MPGTGLDLLGELSARLKVEEWLAKAEEGSSDDIDHVTWDACEGEPEAQEEARLGCGDEQAAGADNQGQERGVAAEAESSQIPLMEFEGEHHEVHVRIRSKNCFADMSEADLRRAVYTISGVIFECV